MSVTMASCMIASSIHSAWNVEFFGSSPTADCEAAQPSRSHPSYSRTFTTLSDQYFRDHGVIPSPTTSHLVLERRREDGTKRHGILVIGDVHGCFDELNELHQTAIGLNKGVDFEYVILVGDLCNKGPYSVAVIRHVRETEGWLTVRGNHDDAALAAALGDENRRKKAKYAWIFEQDEGVTLCDADIEWMAELPYTIRIPAKLLNNPVDTVVVHAGLLPGVNLEEQPTSVMTTLRDLNKKQEDGRVPWASVWKGPDRIVFGHDAKRGLQRYPGDKAIGLDTGACYGKKLTGLILPEKIFVQVQSRKVYAPPGIGRDD